MIVKELVTALLIATLMVVGFLLLIRLPAPGGRSRINSDGIHGQSALGCGLGT